MSSSINASITVETDLFEHREVKPHFINPCCFGEDFAAWLRQELAPLAKDGFEISEPIQEDYGWGFWVSHGKDGFWIALSYVGNGPQEEPPEWVVSVDYDAGLNPVKRLFHKPDQQAFDKLREEVWHAIASNAAITVVESDR